ncbi:MAG: hypothetical protein H8E33_03665, partial [Candidatus Cloacimonetes bacterium]|nr:hypothetical protein [Candidatus Cloacimonadota bacterium]
MKKYYFISLIIVFVLIFISCSKDPTSTSDNCFFTIYVKDTNGNPVEGLNVSIMHQLTIDISDKSLSGFNMSREYSNVNGDENIFAYDRAHP